MIEGLVAPRAVEVQEMPLSLQNENLICLLLKLMSCLVECFCYLILILLGVIVLSTPASAVLSPAAAMLAPPAPKP